MNKLTPHTNLSDMNRIIPVLDKLILFSLFTFAAFSLFSISVTQISFAIGSLSWLYKVHLTQTWKELKGTWVGIAILCFSLACVLSITTSVDFENSIKHLKKLIQLVIFFWVANSVQSEKQRDLLVGLVIIAGAIAALNGLLPLLKPSFFSPARLYGEIRPVGTMGVPATFSGILMLVGLVALGKFLFNKPKEFWVLGSLGIIGICLLFTLTRQAWLGFFIGSVFLLLFWDKKFILAIPVILGTLLFVAPENIKNRIFTFNNFKESSFQARISLSKSGWKIFKNHSVTGCGYKCVDSIYSQYPDPSGWLAHHRGLHSNIFQLLVDTGIVGLVTWLSIWAAYFTEAVKQWRTLTQENSQGNAKNILMGSVAATIAFLVGGLFESNIYDSEMTMLLYFLMGLSLVHIKKCLQVE
jgi:putative inorganic carbon (hco3(-)) transporter